MNSILCNNCYKIFLKKLTCLPNEAEAKIERWMNKNPDNSWVQETGLRILRKLLRKK